jgi:hypothetical protein
MSSGSSGNNVTVPEPSLAIICFTNFISVVWDGWQKSGMIAGRILNTTAKPLPPNCQLLPGLHVA